jgi:multidrug efflux pump subunit AcrA (membrane-fusion protein)
MKRNLITWLTAAAVIAGAAALLYVTRPAWGPAAAAWLDPAHRSQNREPVHDRATADTESRIELSEQAQQNIGLETIKLESATFSRTITVPGIVVEKPGHSDVEVTAPIAGVVRQVYPLPGETVEPRDPLFRLRLTHEEIVQAQADLLKTTEELDVVSREIARIEKITEGVIPGKTKVERQYDQQKLEAVQRAQIQALILHGLSEEQVQGILKERKLLQEVLVFAPGREGVEGSGLRVGGQRRSEPESAHSEHQPLTLNPQPPQLHTDLVPPRARRFFELENLFVDQGQHVAVGKPLCKLGDHTSLYVEGRAFEREAQLITNTLAKGWKVAASLESGTTKPEIIDGLNIVYVSNAVDRDSRAFHFYVDLENKVVRDSRTEEGHRFVTWKYKPGQRVQLLVPVEQWPNRLVVPAEAVVQEGAETFVFQRNGDLFERRTVHVEYQDQRSAVLANDGSVFPGEHIVVTGAYQLHLAIKNKAGNGVDAHAGHQH